LGQADQLPANRDALASVCRSLGSPESRLHRWRDRYGGMNVNEPKRLKFWYFSGVLYIHVGLGKTGSTAIQKSLAKMSMDERGGFALVQGEVVSQTLIAGRNVGGTISKYEDNPLHRRTRKLLNQGHKVVLSNESLLGNMYLIYPKAREASAALRDIYMPISDFRLVLYVRPQVAWVESLFSEYVRSEGGADSAQSFFDRTMKAPYLRYTSLIRDIGDQIHPSRLIVRPYVESLDVVADFQSLLGIPQNTSSMPVRRNASESSALTVLFQLINQTEILSKIERQWLMDRFRYVSARSIYSVLPLDAQRRLLNLMTDDWYSLTESIKDTCQPEPALFSMAAKEVESKYPRDWVGSDLSSRHVQTAMYDFLSESAGLIYRRERALLPQWPLVDRLRQTHQRSGDPMVTILLRSLRHRRERC